MTPRARMTACQRTPPGLAVEVSGLTKSYGEFQAVGGVDFAIGVGEIFALLGPNGAGKTTIVEILEGYRSRDGGDVRVLGLDPGRDRKALNAKIGIVLQSSGIERYLSVSEAIEMYGKYYPAPRPVDELIELVGLEEKRDARVISLSGGQQRRLDVAIGLVGDPDLIFLDEPTTGFDPSARREAWEMVKNLAALGKTVLLTTHYMDEAQYLADRVAVIAAGRFVAEGTPATLAGRNTARARLVLPAAAGGATVAELGWSSDDQGRAVLEPSDLAEALYSLSSWARANGVSLDEPRDPSSLARGRVPRAHRRRRGGPSRPGCTSWSAARPPPMMRTLRLTFIQLRYVNKTFWRNPAAAIFTFGFPLMFLVIFTVLLGHGMMHLDSRVIRQSTYYVAAMAAFGVITSSYTNVAMTVTFQRDAGILKRTNGTPLPAVSYFGAKVLHALFVALLLVALTAAFGRVFYQADVPTGMTLVRFLVMVVVGSTSFCALGVAVTSLIPNADSAPAIVNATILPLLFLSGIFIPLGNDAPAWVTFIARVFPVHHFASGLQAGFIGTPFSWTDVAGCGGMGGRRLDRGVALLLVGAALGLSESPVAVTIAVDANLGPVSRARCRSILDAAARRRCPTAFTCHDSAGVRDGIGEMRCRIQSHGPIGVLKRPASLIHRG